MNTASGGDGIPVELFPILKDDAMIVLHSKCQQIWKNQQWTQDWKRSLFTPIPKKGNAKEGLNYRKTALISPASKVMLKILQARLEQYMKFQVFKLDLENAEEPEIKLPTSVGSSKKAREFQKNTYFCFIDYTKTFSQQTVESSSRDVNTRPPDLPLEKSVCRSGSNS